MKKRQAKYIAGLKNYMIRGKILDYGNLEKHKAYRKHKTSNSRVCLLLGLFIMCIGIISIFKNTIVYSPFRGMYSTTGGVSFKTSSIILFIGIVMLALRKRAILGIICVALGIVSIVISIFFSLRMSLLPISLINAILIFGAIFLGGSLIIKGILQFIRK
ncbi:hypothetical protein [Clostridium sp. D53t1_180928_C8]|uniref:hypothetical protein n=1 Tax=Clostridium sp. D53t1_180928_C8 TaxID=2787101 RepID=UPI0018AB9D83|nr:hypothetical protein [Clostridium sp. D53t1_180928_C8]